MPLKLTTLSGLVILATFLISGCIRDEQLDQFANPLLGNYRVSYTYSYPFLDTSGWNSVEVNKVDNTCDLIIDADGNLFFSNFDFFNDIPLATYIEEDSICMPTYLIYGGGISASSYRAYGNVVNNTLVLDIYKSYYDWSLMATVGYPGVAVATKIE